MTARRRDVWQVAVIAVLVLVGVGFVGPAIWRPVALSVMRGPQARSDRSATIGGVVGDRLVDDDGDGVADALVVDVAVTVGRQGWYELIVDFTDGAGDVAFSAPGDGELEAGPGQLSLRAPVEALVAGGQDGPYVLTHAVMFEGDHIRVADAGEVAGRTGAYPRSALQARELDLLGTTLTADPATGLIVAAEAVVDAPGLYRITGTVTGPDGVLLPVALTRRLDVGVHHLSIDVSVQRGTTLAPGTYSIIDLTLTPEAAAGRSVLGRPATTVVPEP